ncbi:hypothetical protein AB4343_02300 [Vibrio breoganii]|nr:hypothetical protein [Vibrio breoganii]
MNRSSLFYLMLATSSAAMASDLPENFCETLKLLDENIEATYEAALSGKKDEYGVVRYRVTEALSSKWDEDFKELYLYPSREHVEYRRGYITAMVKFANKADVEAHYEKWKARGYYGKWTYCPID